MKMFSDHRFLTGIHRYERWLAKILALLLAIVVGVGTLELFVDTLLKIANL